ncbi:hypothetical protein [Streptomyces mirabilis]|uniref:hypothetical protein n=1 Tax=Streptomyces mirabilis TaxID=68239 RepID=UPI002251CCB6|nr:hypothetical protein [Streptomyces mirabilis]MCX4426460.1 hypothetical protein [Streptomyces mirabilis]
MDAEHARCVDCSFLCLDCGHSWDGTYDIDITVDEYGHIAPVYYLDGRQSPRCPACENHEVRAIRRGRVPPARPHAT